jgi:lipoic acid synthetase
MSDADSILETAARPPIRSGEKYQTEQGFTAIKDGIRPLHGVQAARDAQATAALLRKPPWLRAKLASGQRFDAVKAIVREYRLSTVCEEAKCPNIGECWNAGTATIMLMGAVCTRACRFCAVDTGNPRGWLDAEEPENTARSVELMRLNYVVLTSVNRDDLADGGAAHYAAAIRAIKQRCPHTAVEALTPDFQGVAAHVHTVVESGLEVFAQNMETVERLTLGQYLRPTPNHLDVQRFVTPSEFDAYRQWALGLGFLECVSGPLVRSSYRAEQALARNNAGLDNAAHER